MDKIKKYGLDIGNSYTKVYSKDEKGVKEFMFPSLLKNNYDKYSEEENKIQVKYKDKQYTVGIGSKNVNAHKYFTETFKIHFLTAIAKISESNKLQQCDVVISVPIQVYTNDEIKNKIIKEISSWGIQEIEVDNKMYTIQIKSIHIWSEAGIIISNPSFYAEKKVVFVDIGGYTWDIAQCEYNKRTRYSTTPKGIMTLKDEIYKNFKMDYSANLSDSSVEELFSCIMKNAPFKLNGEEIKLDNYRVIIENYVNDIFNELAISHSSDDLEIHFIGGGAMELKYFLKKYKGEYKFKILDNANMLNAKANYDFAVINDLANNENVEEETGD